MTLVTTVINDSRNQLKNKNFRTVLIPVFPDSSLWIIFHTQTLYKIV